MARAAEAGVRGVLRASAWTSAGLIALVFAFIALEAFPGDVPPPRARSAPPMETYGEDALGPEARALAERATTAGAVPASASGGVTGAVWDPHADPPAFGLQPLLVGTLKVAGIALALGAPLGIGAAVFTIAFAPRRLAAVIKPAVELLAGIPTVVVGFLGLSLLAPVLQEALGYDFRLNAFLAGLGVSVAVVPIVYTIAEDALWRVPGHLREGSLALGATRWQTTWRMLLPAAIPGILAGVVLALGRAVGETMIVLMISGNAPLLSVSPFDPARTMSATLASEMGTVVPGDPHYHALYAVAVVLFLMTLAATLAGSAVLGRARLRKGSAS